MREEHLLRQMSHSTQTRDFLAFTKAKSKCCTLFMTQRCNVCKKKSFLLPCMLHRTPLNNLQNTPRRDIRSSCGDPSEVGEGDHFQSPFKRLLRGLMQRVTFRSAVQRVTDGCTRVGGDVAAPLCLQHCAHRPHLISL